ncbi:MAG: hypothetical protein Q8M54_09785 [Desulfobaccales bacterium]|nr:hypothetical protein [Desulfobaccales bacterium]
MNKTDYIIRQIAKSYKKKYENYVITRIWHLLNNLNIKFVTQQHITRPTGRALTDMYFPQIQLHIEVDESQHFNADGTQVEQDIVREADIINATGHIIKRISIFAKSIEDNVEKSVENNIENINQQIDEVVDFIQNEIKTKIDTETLHLWDIEAEYNPQTYIDRGSISVDDNVAFRTIAHACNCFGHDYAGYQKAFAKHAVEEKMLWFPKLYENEEWENEISSDETEIRERYKLDHKAYFDKAKSSPDNLKERITFARVRSNLGDVMYRFKGVYKFDVPASEYAGKIIYKRTSNQVKTYKPMNHE